MDTAWPHHSATVRVRQAYYDSFVGTPVGRAGGTDEKHMGSITCRGFCCRTLSTGFKTAGLGYFSGVSSYFDRNGFRGGH